MKETIQNSKLRNKLSSVFAFSTLALIVCTSKSIAISPGFYDAKSHPETCREILKVFAEADKTLHSYGMNNFVIKAGKRGLTRKRVIEELKSSTEKNLLLLSFENNGWSPRKPHRGWPLGGPRYTNEQISTYDRAIKRLMPFIRSLGFKRVLMVTPTMSNMTNGQYVLMDYSND